MNPGTTVGFTIFQTALLLVLLAFGQLAIGANSNNTGIEIVDLRIGLTPGRSRAVFDLSGPSSYKLKTLENPARVVVEIQAATSSFDHRKIPLQGTSIGGISSQVQPDASLWYVFDITQESSPTLFALKPYQEHGHRLVLDLNINEKPGEAPGRNMEPASNPTMELAKRNAKQQSLGTSAPQSTADASNPVSDNTSGQWSGYISLDTRLFFQSAQYPEQDDQNISVAFQPEYYVDWANGAQRFAFSPFFRYDANDDERTHADVRELYWTLEHGQFLVKTGLDVVFWGVAESRHLVDIINQTDLVENIDGEDKLGQPMVNLDYSSDWGTWQLYVLPYFRERTFPGEDGRLRTQPVVNTNDPEYESGSEEKHIDFALRWSHYIGDWDIGLAHFSGTSREPLLLPANAGDGLELIPYYQQIDQTSLDAQATIGAWLWKVEAIYNQNDIDDYYAYVGGFEYTRFGVAEGPGDLGWLVEYNYDERGESATTALQDDIYTGVRWTANDIDGTQFLAVIGVDIDTRSTFGNIEASRRLGEFWTLELEMRVFSNIDEDDLLYFYRHDDYIEIEVARHF